MKKIKKNSTGTKSTTRKSYHEISEESIDEKLENFRSISNGVFSLDASDLLILKNKGFLSNDILDSKITDFKNQKVGLKKQKYLLKELFSMIDEYSKIKDAGEVELIEKIKKFKLELEEKESLAQIKKSDKEISERQNANSIEDLEV